MVLPAVWTAITAVIPIMMHRCMRSVNIAPAMCVMENTENAGIAIMDIFASRAMKYARILTAQAVFAAVISMWPVSTVTIIGATITMKSIPAAGIALRCPVNMRGAMHAMPINVMGRTMHRLVAARRATPIATGGTMTIRDAITLIIAGQFPAIMDIAREPDFTSAIRSIRPIVHIAEIPIIFPSDGNMKRRL